MGRWIGRWNRIAGDRGRAGNAVLRAIGVERKGRTGEETSGVNEIYLEVDCPRQEVTADVNGRDAPVITKVSGFCPVNWPALAGC